MSTENEEPLTPVDKFDLLIKDFNTLMETAKTINARLKLVQKEVTKAIKSGSKRTRRVVEVDPDAPKKISALQRPVVISNELCKFLGFAENTEHSRQEVTTTINAYIKTHKLQDENNRRFIMLEGSDEAKKLKVLLREPDQPVTFFNIQRYLKPHYPVSEKDKKAAEAGSVAPVVAPPVVPVVEDASVVADTPKGVVPVSRAPVKKRVVRSSPVR